MTRAPASAPQHASITPHQPSAAPLRRTTRGAASEGSPVLREPALPASAAMDGGAQAASRERRPWMAGASVRRRGTGDPEATFESRIGEAQRASYLWATSRRGRQKFRRFSEDLVTPQAFADPRLAFALARKPKAQPLVPQRGDRNDNTDLAAGPHDFPTTASRCFNDAPRSTGCAGRMGDSQQRHLAPFWFIISQP